MFVRKKRKRVETKRGNAAQRSRGKADNSKELKNFYRFQMREEKTKKLGDLRKKFEEDKQRVAQMKASRSFKPF
jgi:ribosomal RNA-processing protein 7